MQKLCTEESNFDCLQCVNKYLTMPIVHEITTIGTRTVAARGAAYFVTATAAVSIHNCEYCNKYAKV